jgi:hypothetical protein
MLGFRKQQYRTHRLKEEGLDNRTMEELVPAFQRVFGDDNPLGKF